MQTIKFDFKISDYSFSERIIPIDYITSINNNILNIGNMLNEIKKELYSDVIYKDVKELTYNGLTKYSDNILYYLKNNIKAFKYFVETNDRKKYNEVSKPNLYITFYENDTELFSYEINLPKKGKFNYKIFDSVEFRSIVNSFQERVERKIIMNQIQIECDNYSIYNGIIATENLDKTLERIARLPQEERSKLIWKSYNNRMNENDRTRFYDNTKLIENEKEG